MKELIIKERNPFTIVSAIIMTLLLLSFLLPVNRQLFKEQPIASTILAGVLFTILMYSLYKFFDRTVKLRIDTKGIWTRKFGYILWNDIQYYYYPSTIDEYGYIVIKSISFDKELDIDISYFNISTTELDRAISENCQATNVIRLLD
jgi:hypothetical protein